MRVNISQLKAFVEVVDRGSFSEAARRLGISQPAVTMQVQTLEAAMGATLLDRHYRRVDLTEAGALFLPRARHVLEELMRAEDEIANMGGTVSGRLVVAASTTPGQYLLPHLLGGFLAKHAGVSVGIDIGDTARVLELVKDGEAQFGVVGAKVPGVEMGFEELTRDELVMICPLGSPLRERRGILLAELARESFIMRQPGSGTRRSTEDAFRREGVDPGDLLVVTELGTSEAIVRAVEGGLGISVVSKWVAEKALELATVAEVPVAGFPMARPFYLVTPRGTLSRAAVAFIEHLRSAV